MTPETLRARAATMRKPPPHAAAAPTVRDAPAPASAIRLLNSPSVDRRAVQSAISYAKFLGANGGSKRSTVFIDKAGKALYERVLREVRQLDRATGAVRLMDGERREVLHRLCRLPGGVVRLISPVQKFVDGGLRMVRGFASTGDVDRQSDIVVPSGMKAQLPVPLLWQHDQKQPIGTVRSAEIRPEGIWIEASIVSGVQRADEAWALIDARAVDSFSIGFRGLKSEPIAGGGMRFTSWELYEVSIVSVPANANAKIRRSI